MNWHIKLYILSIVFSFSATTALAAYAFRQRKVVGGLAFGGFCFLGAWGAFTELMSLISVIPESAVIWFNLRYIALAGFPVTWLIFTIEFTGKSQRLTIFRIILLYCMPVLTQILIWTNEFHKIWVKSSVGFFKISGFLIFDTSQRIPDVWFYVHSIYSYTCLILGVLLIIIMTYRLIHSYKKQALILALGTAILIVGSLIPTLRLIPGKTPNPVTLSLTLSSLLFAWAIFKYRFLDIAPIARSLLIDSMEDSMVVLDMNNRIVDINPAMKKLLKKAFDSKGSILPEKLIGRHAIEVFYHWTELVNRFKDETKTNTEFEIIFNGDKLFFDIKLSSFVSNKGDVTGRIMTLRDITHYKETEDEVNRLSQAIKQNPASIIITDLKGNIEYVNPKFTKLTGYTVKEVIGKNPRILKSGYSSDSVYKDLWMNITSGKEWRGEFQNIKKNGDTYWEFASISPIFSMGKITNYLAVKEDITERKIAEEKLQKSETALIESENKLRDRNLIMEKDLKIAQIAQKEIILKNKPEYDRLRIDFRYEPMEKVGGDYFSFHPGMNDSLGFFIGDVSGHGVASALFIALLKSTTDRMFREYGKEPSTFLTNLNKELLDYMASYFVTGIYGVFNPSANNKSISMKFSNGGHPLPIVIRKNGSVTFAGESGTIIGIMDNIEYTMKEEIFSSGDIVIFYTDGIPETIDEDGSMIGFDEEMLDLINRSHRTSLSKTLDTILEEVHRIRGTQPIQDDITILGFEVI